MRYKVNIKYGEYIITHDGVPMESYKSSIAAEKRAMELNSTVKRNALNEIMRKELKNKPKQK